MRGDEMHSRILTLLSTRDVAEFRRAGHWTDATVYASVRSAARRDPSKVAVRERFRHVTYADLIDAADRLAAELEAQGLGRGDRLAVWLPSRAETAAAVLACSRNRYVCCPSLHRSHTVAEVSELLHTMRASALIAEEGYGADSGRGDIFGAVAEISTLKTVVRLRPLAGEARPPELFGELPGSGEPRAACDAGSDADTVVYLAFTSGSTGRPKGVLHSDNTLLSPARAMAADWDLDQEMVVYSLSPLSHNLGFGAMLMALSKGGELVVHDLAPGESLANRLAETRATFAFGVPTHAIDLLGDLRARRTTDSLALKGFRLSGAASPESVIRGLLDHGIAPQSGYGMTEGGSFHYTRPGDDAQAVLQTCGQPCAGVETAVCAPHDPNRLLAPGSTGQIVMRGSSLMLGYFGDQEATEDSFNDDGWFLTGDLGSVDEAGYLRIAGRTKDVIIRGGRNIYPAKMERLAMTHELVSAAAAVAVKDGRLGERVCLVIAPRSGHEVPAPELLEHLGSAGLSKYDMPEYVLELPEMPLLASGKIAKLELSAAIANGRLRPAWLGRGEPPDEAPATPS